jgi:hypothetical protein
MVEPDWFIKYVLASRDHPWPLKKKADVTEHTNAFGHVGLLVNWLPDTAGSPFI